MSDAMQQDDDAGNNTTNANGNQDDPVFGRVQEDDTNDNQLPSFGPDDTNNNDLNPSSSSANPILQSQPAQADFDDIFGGGEDDDDMRENVDSLAGSDSEEEENRALKIPIKKKAGAAPVRRKKKEKSTEEKQPKKRRRKADDTSNVPLTDREMRDKKFEDQFQAVIDKIKPKKASKSKDADGDSTETSYDALAEKLRVQMLAAARKDAELHAAKEVSLEKVKFLPTVQRAMARKHLYDTFIDNEILPVMKEWLEPLRPDGVLPSLDIQRLLIDALSQMSVTIEHLRSSGIGRVIKFYTHPLTRCSDEIRRKAQVLLDRWTNLVLGRSMNYRDTNQQVRDVRQERIARPAAKVLVDDDRIYAQRPQGGLPAFKYVPKLVLPKDGPVEREMPEHLSKLSKKLNNIGRSKK
ncbi:hypothetical protein SmJEL517_g04438 [Synchytrium microbalum]|uniref:TFIIS N-terminal domain-containing protein n=1 Tax=Synchytrium microbalum TaxID=1806994 RepID=A0A507C4T0_9FUNG|nr:uncharacterized protein SmJEL517_g04438 [Synchytrium microbalum]TPX32435.1 hypothetical protein SmJEL517_g04438 [Synchytrium microbalum]